MNCPTCKQALPHEVAEQYETTLTPDVFPLAICEWLARGNLYMLADMINASFHDLLSIGGRGLQLMSIDDALERRGLPRKSAEALRP